MAEQLAQFSAGTLDEDNSRHVITRQSSIYAVLKSLYRHRSPLTLYFKGASQAYTSMILKADLESGYFILDEITPPSGHKRALSGEIFSARSQDRGVEVFFSGNKVTAAGQKDGVALYKVPLPTSMLYKQRRGAYRAAVFNSHIETTLRSHERPDPLEGHLVDISSTGCRIGFGNLITPPFQVLEIFESLSFMLPGSDIKIDCAAEARHATYDHDNGVSFCGFHFLEPDTRTQRHIDRFVNLLQMEARRQELN